MNNYKCPGCRYEWTECPDSECPECGTRDITAIDENPTGFYLLTVFGGVEIGIEGGYASAEIRDKAALGIHADQDDECDSIFTLDIDSKGVPTVGEYSGAFFDEDDEGEYTMANNHTGVVMRRSNDENTVAVMTWKSSTVTTTDQLKMAIMTVILAVAGRDRDVAELIQDNDGDFNVGDFSGNLSAFAGPLAKLGITDFDVACYCGDVTRWDYDDNLAPPG